MAKPKDTYTSEDIQILSDRDHVRLRLSMYAGSPNLTTYRVPHLFNKSLEIVEESFCPAAYKTFSEICDNSQDELRQLSRKTNKITIKVTDNTITVSDNGRGIPIDMHSSGRYTPEVVFSTLRSGRNFTDDKTSGVIGMNGMGSAITAMCSTKFDIEIERDGFNYTQSLMDGCSVITEAQIIPGLKTRTGTSISFSLDASLFENSIIPETLIHCRAMELAFNNPGLTVQYEKNEYLYHNGLEDIVKNLSEDYFKFQTKDMDFYVIFDHNKSLDETMFTWVNSSLLFDGGMCNTQFMNAFTDKVCASLLTRAKKIKCEVTKNDIRQDLLILASIRLEKPEYDAQSKTRLTGPNLRKPISDMMEVQWRSFSRSKKDWLECILERAALRHKSSSDKKAIKQLSQPTKKKIPGLIDATSKFRHQCILTVTEGLSASSMISEVRDPVTIATYPLTGKINNVHGCTAGDILKMTKIINLIQAIGLVPGQVAVRKNLNYGEIWISTDADPDGDDICSLLVNLFFQFWPELFDPCSKPFIKRLVAPNVVVHKGNVRKHFSNRQQYESVKHKYLNWSVDYYKGLGAMSECDWNIILYDKDFQIPIQDNELKMKDTLSLLFDDQKANERKEWLQ